MDSTLLVSSRIATPLGIVSGAVLIRNGSIEEVIDAVEPEVLRTFQGSIVDCGDQYILPGVIDAHVHVNQPGRTEWEGIETATRAAAAGGITTIIDMPLNSSPVTVSLKALVEKAGFDRWKMLGRRRTIWRCDGNAKLVRCGELAGDLEAMIAAGVMGIKVFLCDSGLEEFPPVERRELDIIMPTLARYRIPLLVHAEVIPNDWQTPSVIEHYREWPSIRSRTFEAIAIQEMIELCAKYDCPTHIVHLSNADALPMIRRAKRDRLPLTIETCPHYLLLLLGDDPRSRSAIQMLSADPENSRIDIDCGSRWNWERSIRSAPIIRLVHPR